jgi:hypothetical protein
MAGCGSVEMSGEVGDSLLVLWEGEAIDEIINKWLICVDAL